MSSATWRHKHTNCIYRKACYRKKYKKFKIPSIKFVFIICPFSLLQISFYYLFLDHYKLVASSYFHHCIFLVFFFFFNCHVLTVHRQPLCIYEIVYYYQFTDRTSQTDNLFYIVISPIGKIFAFLRSNCFIKRNALEILNLCTKFILFSWNTKWC